MIGMYATASSERMTIMDFTFPIFISQYHMLQPVPDIRNQYWAPVKPFDSMVTKIKKSFYFF